MLRLHKWTTVIGLLIAEGAGRADSLEAEFGSLHALILPGKDDSQWMKVPWLAATDIWAARQKAAREGRPIMLWYMAGEPLGPC